MLDIIAATKTAKPHPKIIATHLPGWFANILLKVVEAQTPFPRIIKTAVPTNSEKQASQNNSIIFAAEVILSMSFSY